MKIYARWISVLTLGLMVAGALICANGKITPETNRTLIWVGTIIWFGITPIWMKKG